MVRSQAQASSKTPKAVQKEKEQEEKEMGSKKSKTDSTPIGQRRRNGQSVIQRNSSE
jgi:hypothetical protein